jgi:hypothetical protein
MASLIRPTRLAQDLDCHPSAIYTWIRTGVIPAEAVIRIGASVRINIDILAPLIEAGALSRAGRHAKAAVRAPEEAACIR